MPCNGPGPRQRRATKIANRSHVTPFDRLAQWNAQIMRLGSQGAVPSIVGNDLQFKKLSASDISGAMQNPATEDLIMGQWDILFSANGNIGMTNGVISGVQNLNGGSSGNLTLGAPTSINIGNGSLGSLDLNSIQTKITGTTLLDLSGSQINIDAGAIGLQMSSDRGVTIDANGDIEIDAALRLDLSGSQINIDAGAIGLQMSSDRGVTIDANGDIEIDAVGRLDLSGNQIFIKSDASGVNVSSATNITMDAAKLDLSGTNMTINSSNNLEVKANATLDLSSDNTKLNGITTVDIAGTTINVGTSSSTVDISGQITLNNVVDLKATDITASGTIQGGSLTDGVATLNAGALSGATTITSNGQIQGGSLTDGTATMSSGDLNGIHDLSIDNSGSFIVNTNITGFDLIKIDAFNKTSTFNFNSSTASSSIILKDLSGGSTFIKQQGTTLLMENSDLQVGALGVEKKVTAGEITGWFNTRDYFAVAKVTCQDSGGGMPQALVFDRNTIINNCPGSITIIPTSTVNSIEPSATGVYTVTITGFWDGDAWDPGSDRGQPMILMYGPAYEASAPGGLPTTQLLAMQTNARFYNSGYTNYATFNWTGRMVHEYNNGTSLVQAKYSFSCKHNGGSPPPGTLNYTGQLQVTRIC